MVRRQRLLTLLDDLAEYPVTALVAPAGAGKTVLAADWLAHSARPAGWVTLDRRDQDAGRLRRSLARASELLASGSMAGATSAAPMTMVIDDVERIDGDADAAAVLAGFVEQRPPWLRLLLVSRRRPPLPVERMRASGDLADLHFDTLRFSDDEAMALLATLCPDLGPAELMVARERAGGWAAALQLSALAVRSRRRLTSARAPIAAASARDRLVAEYVWKEVLEPERPDLLGLLLATAVATRISYAMAEALTQRSDAHDLLDEAVCAGLYLPTLDGEWFELHGLVREVLLTRLQLRSPETLRTQHARAALWCESVGNGVAALGHWLSAQRPADALRVLADLALPLIDTGRAAHVLDTLERVPADALSADPVDALRYAWCQLAAGPSAFIDAVAMAGARVEAAEDPSRSRVAALRAVALWLRGDWRRAAAEARAALTARTTPPPGDPVDRFGHRLVAAGIALDERWDEEAPGMSAARAACLDDPASRASVDSLRALGLALAGRPLAALHVVESASPAPGASLPATLRNPLTLASAVAEREQDHREPARALLDELAGTPTYPDPVLQLVAQLELVRLRMSAGDLATASAALDDAERLCAGLGGPTPGSPLPVTSPPTTLVARAGVELALAGDDPATAVRWREHVVDPFWGPACDAKIWLARGRQDEAVHALRRALPRCPRHEVVTGLLVGQALIPQDRSEAVQRVGTTLELAAAHGMLRTVASEGAAVMELIELAAWRVPEDWLDRLRHALVPAWASHAARRPVEDLTDRERDVLRLLPSRLTLSEIASELFVSQNTLKFHLRAIYRKLGAVSRAEAVETARRMRLLPRG